jgi:hypothetical protein
MDGLRADREAHKVKEEEDELHAMHELYAAQDAAALELEALRSKSKDQRVGVSDVILSAMLRQREHTENQKVQEQRQLESAVEREKAEIDLAAKRCPSKDVESGDFEIDSDGEGSLRKDVVANDDTASDRGYEMDHSFESKEQLQPESALDCQKVERDLGTKRSLSLDGKSDDFEIDSDDRGSLRKGAVANNDTASDHGYEMDHESCESKEQLQPESAVECQKVERDLGTKGPPSMDGESGDFEIDSDDEVALREGAVVNDNTASDQGYEMDHESCESKEQLQPESAVECQKVERPGNEEFSFHGWRKRRLRDR